MVSQGRSRVGKRPWPFRLILWLVDLTAMVFSHVLFATPFFGHGGRRTLSANFGKFLFEVCLGGQVVAPNPSIEVSEEFFIHRTTFAKFI